MEKMKFVTPWIFHRNGLSAIKVWDRMPGMDSKGHFERVTCRIMRLEKYGMNPPEFTGEFETDNSAIAEEILKFGPARLVNPQAAADAGVSLSLLQGCGYAVHAPFTAPPPMPEPEPEPEMPDFNIMQPGEVVAWAEGKGIRLDGRMRKDKLLADLKVRLAKLAKQEGK